MELEQINRSARLDVFSSHRRSAEVMARSQFVQAECADDQSAAIRKTVSRKDLRRNRQYAPLNAHPVTRNVTTKMHSVRVWGNAAYGVAQHIHNEHRTSDGSFRR